MLSSVEPGYLTSLLPDQPPVTGEHWRKILQDVDKVIVPGLTNWHSPHFHAYFPTANSFPGIVGELFSSGLGILSKDWVIYRIFVRWARNFLILAPTSHYRKY